MGLGHHWWLYLERKLRGDLSLRVGLVNDLGAVAHATTMLQQQKIVTKDFSLLLVLNSYLIA